MDRCRDQASRDATFLLAAVRRAAERHRLFAPGDRILVGVSGGPDSVALLHALALLRSEYALTLSACHVHHGLRPEADRDAEFVRGLAGRLNCPVTVERVTVTRAAGRSPEAAARAVRYAALQRVRRASGATKVALGHTADDQAETVLMRVLQGAGPRGLAGIPVRRGLLIRPLLGVDRTTVLAHLGAFGLSFVEDATNQNRKLLRNRIRHELLPLLAVHGWPQIDDALRRLGRASRETVEALDALLTPRVEGLIRADPAGWRVDLATIGSEPPGVVKALLRLVLVRVAPARELRTGLRAVHLRALEALLESPIGARVRLPGGVIVERAREALWVGRPARTGTAPVPETPVVVPGETTVPGVKVRLVAELGRPASERPADPAWEAWFDADALPAALAVRARRPGDRLVPFGGDGPVRVSGLLARAGIPGGARDAWPLLVGREAAREEVLWVIGVRRGRTAPVGPETTTVLRVRATLDRPSPEEGELT